MATKQEKLTLTLNEKASIRLKASLKWLVVTMGYLNKNSASRFVEPFWSVRQEPSLNSGREAVTLGRT